MKRELKKKEVKRVSVRGSYRWTKTIHKKKEIKIPGWPLGVKTNLLVSYCIFFLKVKPADHMFIEEGRSVNLNRLILLY